MPNPIEPSEDFKQAPDHVRSYRDPIARATDGGSVYYHEDTNELQIVATQQASRCIVCKAPACILYRGLTEIANAAGCLINHPPDWLEPMAKDNWHLALERHNKTSIFGLFYGLLCPAPCEVGCTMVKGKQGEGAVNIHEAEGLLYQWAYENDLLKPREYLRNIKRNGMSVAVIGGGIAGLEAADALNQSGFNVTVYEKSREIGGILRWEIPGYKFPDNLPQADMVKVHQQILAGENIKFETNCPIEDNYVTRQILAMHDAVVIATGATVPNYGAIPDKILAHPRVTEASLYLDNLKRDGSASTMLPKGKTVVIAGNRDTAADVIGESIRAGAKEIFIIDRNPAKDKEYTSHQELRALNKGAVVGGVVIHEVTANQNDKLGIVLKRYTSSRSLNPEGVVIERTIEADMLIAAMGYQGARPDIANLFGVQMVNDPRGGLVYGCDKQTGFSISNPKWDMPPELKKPIWIAGDSGQGATILMEAGAFGRRTAGSIAATLDRNIYDRIRKQHT